jgi:TIR domain-containing protein
MVWPVEIFCCYAREDLPLLKKLRQQLEPLRRQRLIILWSDTDLNAGEEWEKILHQHLNTAHIILLLISPDFMESEYCYSVEMKKAIERHERGEARVIPVILNYVDWQFEPLNKLQTLPTGAKPIMSKDWPSQNEALFDVAH